MGLAKLFGEFPAYVIGCLPEKDLAVIVDAARRRSAD
jgi:hypothetical protein